MSATSSPSAPSSRRARLERWAPGLRVLRTYDRSWLAKDLVAGLILSALLIPQGMAYAELAGLPAITGLYTTVICLLAYAIFGPSPRLVLGPDSSLGPMIAAAILPLAAGSADKRHRAGWRTGAAGWRDLRGGGGRATRLRRRPDLQTRARGLSCWPCRHDHRWSIAQAASAFPSTLIPFVQEVRAIVTQLGADQSLDVRRWSPHVGYHPWTAPLGAASARHPLRRPCGDHRYLTFESACAWRRDCGYLPQGFPLPQLPLVSL